MNETDAAYIGAGGMRVRLLRTAERWTQAELGDLSGVSRVTVGSIERGDHPAGLHSYRALAVAFGMPLSELVDVAGAGSLAWDSYSGGRAP
jgi:transcriptional regulator with XRE-family HTH domain